MNQKTSQPRKLRRAPSFFDVLRFAAGYWMRQRGRLAVIMTLVILGAFVETCLPNALASFLGGVRRNDAAPQIWRDLGIFVGIYFTQISLSWTGSFFYNRFETRTFKYLLDDAFMHVHTLTERFFVNTFAGSIISKINRGRTRIETFEDQILMQVIPTLVILTGSIGFLAVRFPMLAVLVTAYLIVLLSFSIWLALGVAGPMQQEYADAQDNFSAHLADSISGIATTKAYAQEKREIGSYVAVTEKLRAKNLRAYLFSNFTGLAQQAILGGMLVLLLGGGTWYFLHGKASVENIAYLSLAYSIMQTYLRKISDNIKNILTSSYDLHAIMLIMKEQPEVADAPDAQTLNVTAGAIDIRQVRFTYPGKPEPVFDGLNLSIKPGEHIALVGHSGSGKSSLVRLLQRAYDLQQGGIFIDGQDIAKVTQHSLRSAMALVPQDPVLFHRSLQANIAYAKPDATFEEVRRAAAQAHIDDFIMTLPEGYDTLVGERGVKLSGGERQRVAIARAILADRPILILDEATSSLDSESEKAIQDALRALIKGRTSIMVAHRLSTILDADRIVVFEQGKIVEQGTHTELLAGDGVYAGFFDLQSGGLISQNLSDEDGKPASKFS